MLLDELSNLDFGWPLVGRFDGWEMGRTAVRVVGGFPLLRGFAADGVAICDDVNSRGSASRPTTELVQFGFLKLQDDRPGERRDCLPHPKGDPAARTSCRILGPRSSRKESDHWVSQTATGKLFAFGVLVATIVASAVIYQVLSNDVRDHLARVCHAQGDGAHQRLSFPRGHRAGPPLRGDGLPARGGARLRPLSRRPRHWPASRCGSRRGSSA